MVLNIKILRSKANLEYGAFPIYLSSEIMNFLVNEQKVNLKSLIQNLHYRIFYSQKLLQMWLLLYWKVLLTEENFWVIFRNQV